MIALASKLSLGPRHVLDSFIFNGNFPTLPRSSFEWNISPYDVPDLFSKPGTPCDNYNGYCDVSQRCREVDPSSPLATLRRLLLSNESMASLKRWFNEQWFYVAVLIMISVLILVGLCMITLTKWERLN